MTNRHWKHFSHPAGTGVRSVGGTMDEASEQAVVFYEMAVTGMLFQRLEVHIEDRRLDAIASGELQQPAFASACHGGCRAMSRHAAKRRWRGREVKKQWTGSTGFFRICRLSDPVSFIALP